MILIADSGSTKCDWVLLNQDSEVVFKSRTPGLNPNMLTTQKMHKRLAKSVEISHVNEKVEQVYFYGSGCGTVNNCRRLKRFLEKYFRNAECHVEEDMMAACLSVTDSPGIVCILGTGSNACYFDGNKAELFTPSLGYIVMDEAGGNYFGKQLLRDYFYKKMPEKIARKFASEYDLDPYIIKKNLYKEDNPNSYLSDFARFMFSYDKPLPAYFEGVITDGLQDFLDHRVLVFPQAKQVPIHFVGSIAHFSKEIITKVVNANGLSLGNITRRPIQGLIAHFQEKIKTQAL